MLNPYMLLGFNSINGKINGSLTEENACHKARGIPHKHSGTEKQPYLQGMNLPSTNTYAVTSILHNTQMQKLVFTSSNSVAKI